MQLVGDPDRLDALARTIAADAENVRTAAQALRRQATAVPWHSAAADVFRQRVAGHVSALVNSAAAMDEAAKALRQHADAVRSHLKLLSDVAERAADVGEDVAKNAGGAVHRFVDGVWW